MYKLFLRPFFFLFQPEKAHHLTVSLLAFLFKIPLVKFLFTSFYRFQSDNLRVEKFGLSFKNPVGLAAGFDKDAKLYRDFEAFGFGFIEVGTITPLAQDGNPKPRMFRLPKNQALINRMGFNNEGVQAMVKRLEKRNVDMIIGGNIGKNKNTPNEAAFEDYLICFKALHPYVDYFVVNVSSPNTPGLRALQEKEPLKNILNQLVAENNKFKKQLPILLKIAPDLTNEQIDDIAEIIMECGLQGIVATNTTIERSTLNYSKETLEHIGAGGLSGKPLSKRSTEIIQKLREKIGEKYLIMGVGGIMNEEDAIEKLKAGADVIQLYTGFIYEGPGLVKRINKAIDQWKKK